jgi:hypothetical protein
MCLSSHVVSLVLSQMLHRGVNIVKQNIDNFLTSGNLEKDNVTGSRQFTVLNIG